MSFAALHNDSKSFSSLDLLYALYRARGRGGMNLGPGGISNNFSNTSSYVINNNQRNSNNNNGGRKGSQLGGGGRRSMGGMNRMSVANSKTGHSVHMRGLPFEATAADVVRFFAPLQPVDIRLLYESNTGRPKGECDVDFTTHNDAEEAMKKDKQNMGHRYIELFLKSTINGKGWSNNNNNNSNNNNNNNLPMGKGSPLMNGNSRHVPQSMNNLYAGGFNAPQNAQGRGRFNNNVLPPIGTNNFNSTTGGSGFVTKQTSSVDAFGAPRNNMGRGSVNDFSLKDGELDINLAYRSLQNGGGVNSFYGNNIL